LGFYAAKNGSSIPTAWPLKTGTVSMEVPSTLCKIPKECRSHLHWGGSLKSHIAQVLSDNFKTWDCLTT
jgi:hypothetical protein